MDRLGTITKELAVLDAKRVPGFLSNENIAFWVALDGHWPTIRGMLTIERVERRSWLDRFCRR
jgi:hypothetical protein